VLTSVSLNGCVSRDRVATRGMGETELIAGNDNERGRELNRRVEVAIYANKQYRAGVAQR
jgi:outer membrane protein OmpA-like peptidoglycan-associated protein